MNKLIAGPDVAHLESELCRLIRKDEALAGKEAGDGGALWEHLQRVARRARQLGCAEGVDPLACYLGGLFHDAGKLATYPARGESTEEERSADLLIELTKGSGLSPLLTGEIARALRQLYRRDLKPSPLAMVVHDADNLDKLGLPGIANFFIKNGLRGRGLSIGLLLRLTVELNYARYAEQRFQTETGRRQARPKARETILFIEDFLSSFPKGEFYETARETVHFEGMAIDLISPVQCECGSGFEKSLRGRDGMKCREIHVEYRCRGCDKTHAYQFCRPFCPEEDWICQERERSETRGPVEGEAERETRAKRVISRRVRPKQKLSKGKT